MLKNKRLVWITLAMAAVPLVAGAQELETQPEKVGYMIGMDIGNSIKDQQDQVDLDALLQGIRDVYEDNDTLLSTAEAQQIRQQYMQQRRAQMQQERQAQAETNLEEGEEFLAENANKEGVEVTDSGLQYKVIEEGDGASPNATDTVTVHYRGKLLNGTEFDSSYSRGQPATFSLDQVIPGWTEGVQLMNVGSKYRFFIPGNLAYGERGSRGIPPNATLIFDVELLDVKSAAAEEGSEAAGAEDAATQGGDQG